MKTVCFKQAFSLTVPNGTLLASMTFFEWKIKFILKDFFVVLFLSGASANAQTHSLETPLSLASKNGHTEIAALLLSFGSNLVSFARKCFNFRLLGWPKICVRCPHDHSEPSFSDFCFFVFTRTTRLRMDRPH